MTYDKASVIAPGSKYLHPFNPLTALSLIPIFVQQIFPKLMSHSLNINFVK